MNIPPDAYLTLFFPCDGQAYAWKDLCCDEERRTQLFQKQHVFIADKDKGQIRFVTDSCGARFTLRLSDGGRGYRLVHLPNQLDRHLDGCCCRAVLSVHRIPDGDEATEAPPPGSPIRGLHGVLRDAEDPEFAEVSVPRSDSRISCNRTARKSPSSCGISFRKFGSLLLQESGVCDWKPAFRGKRSQRAFNGRVLSAISSEALSNKARAFAAALSGEGAILGAWTQFDPSISTPFSISGAYTVVGFGFLRELGAPRSSGARAALISGSSVPLIIGRKILSRMSREKEAPLAEGLPGFPVWCIFVARKFGDEWKALSIETFRTTPGELLPVSSNNEEGFCAAMVGRNRTFRRWLVPPTGADRHIPDFELLDLVSRRYVEVAGLLDDPEYAARMEKKMANWGARLLVWDTRTSLEKWLLKNVPDAGT